MSSEHPTSGVVEIQEILERLPHRYPFALLDRVLSFEPHKVLVAIKNVTINEPFFVGHFPGAPIMPGVLILESLAQACGMLAVKTEVERAEEPGIRLYFAGIDDARFKRPVVPGDQLRLEVELLRRKREIWRFNATASVDGAMAASAVLTCAMKKV